MSAKQIAAVAGAGALVIGLGACGSGNSGPAAKPVGPMTVSLLQSAYPSLTSCLETASAGFACNFSPNGPNGAAVSVFVTMKSGGGISIEQEDNSYQPDGVYYPSP